MHPAHQRHLRWEVNGSGVTGVGLPAVEPSSFSRVDRAQGQPWRLDVHRRPVNQGRPAPAHATRDPPGWQGPSSHSRRRGYSIAKTGAISPTSSAALALGGIRPGPCSGTSRSSSAKTKATAATGTDQRKTPSAQVASSPAPGATRSSRSWEPRAGRRPWPSPRVGQSLGLREDLVRRDNRPHAAARPRGAIRHGFGARAGHPARLLVDPVPHRGRQRRLRSAPGTAGAGTALRQQDDADMGQAQLPAGPDPDPVAFRAISMETALAQSRVRVDHAKRQTGRVQR